AQPTVSVNRAPVALAGAKTGLGSARDVETDAAGRIYVLTPTAVRVFAASARGNAAPVRSVPVSPPNAEATSRVAVDGDGWVYVLSVRNEEPASSSVTVFRPGASTPDGTYSQDDLGVEWPIDLTGVGAQVAIADYGASDVKVFALHSGDTTQVRALAPGTAGPTRIDLPVAIDSDRAGRLVLSGSSWVAVFGPGADSTEVPTTAPQRFVQGSRTGLGADGRVTTGVGLDARGRVLVVSAEQYAVDDVTFATRNPRVLVFAASATGNAAPQAVLRGARSGLGTSSGLEVAPSGALVTNRYDPDAGAWAAGVSVHRPLGPYAAPGKPRTVRVAGAAGAARRTITWKPARTDPDTPVLGYTVKVVCGGATKATRKLPRSARSATVALGSFRRGRCTARVDARNALGTGGPGTISFAVRR
ncbi:hypothetical protein, partial [Nocardioides sp.]|uniref:hypothetical protein n=1 Tax=Nocardioides sp. TaxID=35761 RepID=UPI00271BA48D